jgi:hypothetical protein
MTPLFNGWTIPLRITGMALSNQSELPAFFTSRQVNLKISHRILSNRKLRKMTCRKWPNSAGMDRNFEIDFPGAEKRR